jgi:hypothetical protein
VALHGARLGPLRGLYVALWGLFAEGSRWASRGLTHQMMAVPPNYSHSVFLPRAAWPIHGEHSPQVELRPPRTRWYGRMGSGNPSGAPTATSTSAAVIASPFTAVGALLAPAPGAATSSPLPSGSSRSTRVARGTSRRDHTVALDVIEHHEPPCRMSLTHEADGQGIWGVTSPLPGRPPCNGRGPLRVHLALMPNDLHVRLPALRTLQLEDHLSGHHLVDVVG